MKVWVGIDPGRQGAVGVVCADSKHSYVLDLPLVDGDYDLPALHEILSAEASPYNEVTWALEQVTRPPKLTRCQGIVEGMLAALGQEVTMVRPQEWKSAIGLLVGASKRDSIELARSMFPELAGDLERMMDDGRAEALLIAAWKRKEG